MRTGFISVTFGSLPESIQFVGFCVSLKTLFA